MVEFQNILNYNITVLKKKADRGICYNIVIAGFVSIGVDNRHEELVTVLL